MHIAYTPEQEELRRELRAYFDKLLTPERREALASNQGEYGSGNVYRETVEQMGADGWLALGWPKEFGGQDRSVMDQLIFTDEAAIAGAPVPFLTINSVAPTIMHFGTDEQKKFFLPKIAAGKLHFSIGYSEPGAGTDLASLRTSAVRDGDDYIVNGQKMWTSLIEYADYIWLAVRTNTEVKKHRGISMLIVPTTAEGFVHQGAHDGRARHQRHLLPGCARPGHEPGRRGERGLEAGHQSAQPRAGGAGFVGADHHRAARGSRVGPEHQGPGGRIIDAEWVQLNLARVHAKAEYLKLINWELASTTDAAPPRRCLGHQGLWHRVGHRGLPPSHGGPRHGRDASSGLARRAAVRPRGADAPGLPDSHLRRWHQRGATRHHRDDRSWPTRGKPLEGTALQWISPYRGTDRPGRSDPHHRIHDQHTGAAARTRQQDSRFDRQLWTKLVEADILSTAAPESVGGAGFGVLEQSSILVELGRELAAVPYLESVVLAAGALAAFGSDAMRNDWATPAVAGKKILTIALEGEPGEGPVAARTEGTGYVLTGNRVLVPFGVEADAYLVPAETETGTAVFLVSTDDAGVTQQALHTTGKDSSAELILSEVPVPAERKVGGAEVVEWLRLRESLGHSAYQLGVLERALELTADYARTREQFGKPIGGFQAVAQRLADGYIDVKGLRLTLWQAAWRVSEDLPSDVDVATAKFWAADAGHRVAHTAVHVHGGVGIDEDHPVHRYFLAAKRGEFASGSATEQLRRIGRELADTPA